MNTGIVGLTETTRHNEKELGKSVSSSSNGFGGHYIWKNHLFIPININSIVITIIIIKMRLITIFIIKMGSLGGWFEVQGGKKLDKKRKSCLPEQRGQWQLSYWFNTIESIRRRKNRKYQKVQKGTRENFRGNESSGNFCLCFNIIETSRKTRESTAMKRRPTATFLSLLQHHWNYQKVQKGTRENWGRESVILWGNEARGNIETTRKYQKVQKGTRENWRRGNVAFCGNEASGNFFIVSTSLKQPETRTRKYQGKNEKVQKGTRKNWRRWNVAFLWQWCQKDATDQKCLGTSKQW